MKHLLSAHRILGFCLSVLFLMWFLSGFVMIFHGFPRVTEQNSIEKQQALSKELQAMDSMLSVFPDTAALQSLSLDMHLDRPVFHLRGKALPPNIYADSLQAFEINARDAIPLTVAQWCAAPVLRVDTMRKLNQWIPFERLKSELPIYKYTFADEEKHELYISSKTGKVLQYTNRKQRFWAWLGAIPHWVYFTSLRQHQTLWTNFVIWSSGISCIMCLSGIILGAKVFWRTRRKGFKPPYKKLWYRWHYISGLAFGVFAITFAFSGLMSMTDLPHWMKKKPANAQQQPPPGRRGSNMQGSGRALQLEAFKLDYRTVVANIDGIKKIEWATHRQHPYYRISANGKTSHIDASDSASMRPFVLTKEMINQELKQHYGDSINYTLELITEYDNEYFARKASAAPLPVYRAKVSDEMNTSIYYNPETLSQRRFDDNSRVRSFLYRGLHSLNFKFLTDRPALWYTVMFALLIGGTLLSLTGVVLSFKWIIRKARTLLSKQQ